MKQLLTIKVRHFGQHHPGRGDPEPVVQLEGAGCQFDGVRVVVVVMGAVRVGVGQGRVLAQGGRGVGVHGVAVQRLCGDPRGALRV